MTTETAKRRSDPKRSDALRNIEAILEAATNCLARDPDASINAIAQAAGVGRVTLYGHFESRAVLVAHVVDRAMQQTDEALEALDLGGDPREALTRLVDVSWQLSDRFGALVIAGEQVLAPEQVREAHARPMARWQRVLRRGRKEGCFRKDMPLDWQVTAIHSIIHAASGAVHRGELGRDRAPAVVRATVLGLLTPVG